MLAAGFVFAAELKLAAALLLAVTMVAFALLLLALSAQMLDSRARLLLRVSAALLLPGMLLVAAYSLGEYRGRDWLPIPWMARIHGPLNGAGFVLLGLLAWLRELSPRSLSAGNRVGLAALGWPGERRSPTVPKTLPGSFQQLVDTKESLL
jgi:cytochrome bd-type quinol oxidase subunit 2